MKHESQRGDWYQAKAPNLIVNIYLSTVTSFSEIWKWEIEFLNTDKSVADTSGWATSLSAAKKDALEHAELFSGKGNVGKYYKQKTVYPDEEMV